MPTESKTEFLTRHGGNPELSADERHWLFSDGALMNNSDFPECEVRHEPPDEPRARLPIVKAYWTARIQRIARQLRHLKMVLRGQHPVFQWDKKLGQLPHGLDAPGMAAYLQQLAQEPKAKLAEAEAALAALPQNAAETIREKRLRLALRKRAIQAESQQRQVLETTL